jgi:hypothetical protein
MAAVPNREVSPVVVKKSNQKSKLMEEGGEEEVVVVVEEEEEGGGVGVHPNFLVLLLSNRVVQFLKPFNK